jgi:general secretion pathway protein B
MSYILEALKKSQQERELGQVPRLDRMPYEEPAAEAGPHPWLWASVLLASLAVLLALYVAWRSGVLSTPEPTTQRAAPTGAEVALAQPKAVPAPVPSVAGGSPVPSPAAGAADAGPDPAPGPAVSEPEPVPVPEPAPDAAPPLTASDTSDLSVEPQVLVVPAPPKPGQRLPRGAEELRRAVLGPQASPSVSVDLPPASRPLPHPAPPEPERSPIPDDLIADIEAFKKELGVDAGRASSGKASQPAPAAAKPAPAAPPEPDLERYGPPVPPPSAALRRKLPDFAISVHVYDADPARRFVYINGRKVRERQTTREGLRVEQVVADGAVLSWEGERFFQRR